MNEARWRSIDTFATTRYWWGEAIEVLGETTVRLPLHAVTHRPHPEKLFIRVERLTPAKPYIKASLMDAEGRIYNSALHYIGTPPVVPAQDDTAGLADLIEAAEGPLEAAQAILEAGWQPPEPQDYDDWPEEHDDGE